MVAGVVSPLICFSLIACACRVLEPSSGVSKPTRATPGDPRSRWGRTAEDKKRKEASWKGGRGGGRSGGGGKSLFAYPPPLGSWKPQRSCSPAELFGSGPALLSSLWQRQKSDPDGRICNGVFCHSALWPSQLQPLASNLSRQHQLVRPWRAQSPQVWLMWRHGLYPWGTPQARRRWWAKISRVAGRELEVCTPGLGSPWRRHDRAGGQASRAPAAATARAQAPPRKKAEAAPKPREEPVYDWRQDEDDDANEKESEPRRDERRPLGQSARAQPERQGAAHATAQTQKAKRTPGTRKEARKKTKVDSTAATARLNQAVMQVRGGAVQEGLVALNELIEEDPDNYLAYAWRGVSRSMAGDLQGGLDDLTTANDATGGTSVDILRQKANVLAAMARHREAIQDYTKVLEIDPSDHQARLERGAGFVNSQAYSDALPDLRIAREKLPHVPRAHLFLGLALTASGDPFTAVHSYEAAMKMDPSIREGWTNWGQTMKELADLERAEECYKKALEADPNFLLAYKLWAKLRHGAGHHRMVLELLKPGLEKFPDNVELRYFEASSNHAAGEFTQAITKYDHILSLTPQGGDEDKLQFNAFYQREVAVYTALRVDKPLSAFNMEDFDANFKEHWGRVQTPAALLPLNYHMQPLREALGVQPRISLSSLERSVPGYTLMQEEVLTVARKWGSKIQYNCTGFMINKRQQLMAGLAAMEVMEAVRETWAAMSAGKGVKGAAPDRGTHPFITGWRALYQVAVRWRQVVEPGDPILWIDQLTSIAFESGFGSVTPMISGQTRNIRYSMNADRAFKILKQELVRTRMGYGDHDQEVPLAPEDIGRVKKAKSIKEVYDVIDESFFIVTPCASTAVPGKTLNGTRLVITQEDPGHQFAIRTPLTPSRWKDYDLEMSEGWQSLCRSFLDAKLKARAPEEWRERVLNNVLRMAYYWYNFMPLSRGSAMTGFVVTMGLFGALGYELDTRIPEGMQTDWEAILSPTKEDFISRLAPWMYPGLKEAPYLTTLPEVSEVFPTLGTIFEALSEVNFY